MDISIEKVKWIIFWNKDRKAWK